MLNDWDRTELSIRYIGILPVEDKLKITHVFEILRVTYQRGEKKIKFVGDSHVYYFPKIDSWVTGWPVGDMEFKEKDHVYRELQLYAKHMIALHKNPVVVEHEMLDKD